MVVTIQICMLYIFVRGAEFDVQDGELLMPFAEFHHEISSKRFPPQTMSILFIPTNAQGTPRNAATSLVSSIRRRSFCPLPFSQLVRVRLGLEGLGSLLHAHVCSPDERRHQRLVRFCALTFSESALLISVYLARCSYSPERLGTADTREPGSFLGERSS